MIFIVGECPLVLRSLCVLVEILSNLCSNFEGFATVRTPRMHNRNASGNQGSNRSRAHHQRTTIPSMQSIAIQQHSKLSFTIQRVTGAAAHHVVEAAQTEQQHQVPGQRAHARDGQRLQQGAASERGPISDASGPCSLTMTKPDEKNDTYAIAAKRAIVLSLPSALPASRAREMSAHRATRQPNNDYQDKQDEQQRAAEQRKGPHRAAIGVRQAQAKRPFVAIN